MFEQLSISRSGVYLIQIHRSSEGKIMLVRKVLKAKIIDETNKRKHEALEREYNNFQKALRGRRC